MKTPDKQQLENIRIHLDMLCSDELRKHGFISHEHETDFQVFRALCGYNELMDEHKMLVKEVKRIFEVLDKTYIQCPQETTDVYYDLRSKVDGMLEDK